MKSPLIKRVPREIKREAGKYVVIAIIMILLIGAVSGFLVAVKSLKTAFDDSFEKYNIEDGNFELALEPDEAVLSAIEEEGGVKLYNKYFLDSPTDDFDSTARIFRIREDVDLVSLLDGDLPEEDDEIAMDRLYLKNNKLSVGDKIKISGRELKITGVVALPDYSCAFENNSDFMFDATRFGVAVMTEEGFEAMDDTNLHYCFAWKYNDPPEEWQGKEANDMAAELMNVISSKAMLSDFIPGCQSSAINFAGDDMGGDRIMFIVFLYLLIVIIAFVFAVMTSNTITQEAAVIGTLRASGYTKGEIIRHYMAAPMIVLAVASVLGNVLGYTYFRQFMGDAYLNSYSIVKSETIWSAEAFVLTTIVPFIILAAINYLMLLRVISLPPLKFLRRDLKRRQRKKAFKLNTKLPIMFRYRLRVIFQNIPNYITIFAGIFLSSLIMLFSMLFSPVLEEAKKNTKESMFAEHQYVLKMPAETAEETAEQFAAASLKTVDTIKEETVSVYGFIKGSRYFHTDLPDEGVYISSAYADKYGIEKGDSLKLKEEWEDTEYEVEIKGVYDYPSTLAVFGNIDYINSLLGREEGSFTGYLCNKEITDIDKRLIATEITEEDLTKTSRQLENSMGAMMNLFTSVGLAVFVLVIYLLAKVVIEKNTQSISIAKILGYTPAEVSGIYIRTTSLVTLLSLVLCMPIEAVALDRLWRAMMMRYNGWLAPEIPLNVYFKTVALGAVTYLVVSFVLRRRINKVKLDEALKNAE